MRFGLLMAFPGTMQPPLTIATCRSVSVIEIKCVIRPRVASPGVQIMSQIKITSQEMIQQLSRSTQPALSLAEADAEMSGSQKGGSGCGRSGGFHRCGVIDSRFGGVDSLQGGTSSRQSGNERRFHSRFSSSE